jgi:hypothetical protein
MNSNEWFNILDFEEYKKNINKYEKKATSQNGEDGIIAHIFSNIGIKNKKSCEIGFHWNEANTINLMRNNWDCLFIDANKLQVQLFWNRFKRNYKGTNYQKSRAINHEINIDNINQILSEHDFKGEVDFLSIDIDGNDYFVLKNITCCNPRVICAEYNASFGPHLKVSIPLDSERTDQQVDYWGASYMAFVDLLSNYNLVSVVAGVNLFFVRKDIPLNNLEVIENAWQPPYTSTYENNKPIHENRLKEQYDKLIITELHYI